MINKTKHPSTNRGVFLPISPSSGLLAKDTNKGLNQIPITASVPIPQLGICKTKPVNYVIGWDWVDFTATSFVGIPENLFLFTCELQQKGTAHYNQFYKVEYQINGEFLPFCTIQASPRVGFIPKEIVQIKIENRFLYTHKLFHYINDFLREFQFKFKWFIRLDAYMDFQDVNGYQTPVDFLNATRAGKIIIKAKSMTTYSTRKYTTGITFGAASSGLSINIYNKTLEMQKKTWKPWIEETWKLANFDANQDVFRLEFRVRKSQIPVSNEDGEVLLNFADTTTINELELILNYLYDKHLLIS